MWLYFLWENWTFRMTEPNLKEKEEKVFHKLPIKKVKHSFVVSSHCFGFSPSIRLLRQQIAMLRTKKQVDRVRLFLRPSSAYFAFGNSIRKDAPKVGEEYKSSRTVRSSIPPPECAKHGTVLHRRGLPKLLKFFLLELYFSQDHSIWSHL